MNGKSSAELEQEAENVRARVQKTAEDIRDRMTPGQLIDDAMHYFRHSDSALAFGNLKNQMRDNPLALALVGTGLVWLMTGSGPSGGGARLRGDGSAWRSGEDWETEWERFSSTEAGTFAGETAPSGWDGGDGRSMTDRAGDMASRAGDMAGRAGDTLRDSVHGAQSSASNFAHGVGDTMSRTGRSAAHAGRSAQHQMEAAAGRASRTFSDLLEREPLVIGAIGMAVGAAIGAMLPSTRFEDEHFGRSRDHLKDQAEDMLHQTAEDAKEVARETYAAGASKAEEEGLVPGEEGKPFADRVSSTVKAGVHAAEEKTEEKLGRDGSESKPLSGGTE